MMLIGLIKDICDIDGVCKIVVISRELVRFKVDIVVLQEMCIVGCGSLMEKEYIFFWQGRDEDEFRVYGVGFVVSNKLVQMVELGLIKFECIMYIKFNIDLGFINLFFVYVLILILSIDVKDIFYS